MNMLARVERDDLGALRHEQAGVVTLAAPQVQAEETLDRGRSAKKAGVLTRSRFTSYPARESSIHAAALASQIRAYPDAPQAHARRCQVGAGPFEPQPTFRL